MANINLIKHHIAKTERRVEHLAYFIRVNDDETSELHNCLIDRQKTVNDFCEGKTQLETLRLELADLQTIESIERELSYQRFEAELKGNHE